MPTLARRSSRRRSSSAVPRAAPCSSSAQRGARRRSVAEPAHHGVPHPRRRRRRPRRPRGDLPVRDLRVASTTPIVARRRIWPTHLGDAIDRSDRCRQRTTTAERTRSYISGAATMTGSTPRSSSLPVPVDGERSTRTMFDRRLPRSTFTGHSLYPANVGSPTATAADVRMVSDCQRVSRARSGVRSERRRRLRSSISCGAVGDRADAEQRSLFGRSVTSVS